MGVEPNTIVTCDRRDKSQAFGQPHILRQSRVKWVVGEKGVDWRYMIDDEVQEGSTPVPSFLAYIIIPTPYHFFYFFFFFFF
jgi:hypothetical protein